MSEHHHPVDIVFGGGRYGLKAAEYLLEKNRDFVVIDESRECLVKKKLNLPEFDESAEQSSFKQGSTKELLELFLQLNPEYIFPTAPIHLAASLLAEIMEVKPWNDGINLALSGLPPKIILSAGRGSVVVTYNRDGDCLPNCSAPDVCPVTKIKKPAPMYEMLRFAFPGGFILKSRYLKPGLGAIMGDELRNMTEWAKNREEIVVGTACRCHGVLSSFRRV